MNEKPDHSTAVTAILFHGFWVYFGALCLYSVLQTAFHWPNVSPWAWVIVPCLICNVAWLCKAIWRFDAGGKQ